MMPRDLTVSLEDRPGTLATLGKTLGAAGVNIDGVCGIAGGATDEIHILVDDAAAARSALSDAGIEIAADKDVVLVEFEDRPGELGEIARKVAATDTNISVVYVSCDRRLVLVTNDNDATREGLEST